MEHLCSDLQEYAQGVKGHVRLFANTTAITEFLPGVLSRFLATHRHVNVDLRERLSPIIVRAITDGAADIGIVAGNVRMEGLQVLPYREDRLILVCARSARAGTRSAKGTRSASRRHSTSIISACPRPAPSILSWWRRPTG
jgi:DNA-binding transcriptional LysR family regulator